MWMDVLGRDTACLSGRRLTSRFGMVLSLEHMPPKDGNTVVRSNITV